MSDQLEEAEADFFFKQLMCGVSYIHEMGIAHCDLKRENLLLSARGCMKISDVGNAECLRLDWENHVHMSTRHCGSRPCISPEQYLGGEFDPRLVDIWAAATVYMTMRTGRSLWKIATDDDECFRDYVTYCNIGRVYYVIRDTCHAPGVDRGQRRVDLSEMLSSL